MVTDALLKTEFEKFKSIPFPKDSSDNEILSEIFFDLVQYDSYIAGTIDKLLSGQIVDNKELIYEVQFETRLAEFIDKTENSNDKVLAKEYLEYLSSIKSLLEISLSRK